MKKFIFLLLLPLLTLEVSGQAGVIKHVFDTLNGNEFVGFPLTNGISVTGKYRSLTLDIECTELGGTSDGTLVLQGRNGSNSEWSTLTSVSFGNWISYMTNDTLTIVDAAVWKVEIHDPGFANYRIYGDGTASDTTLVDIYYILKE